jgi:hypothetical protein
VLYIRLPIANLRKIGEKMILNECGISHTVWGRVEGDGEEALSSGRLYPSRAALQSDDQKTIKLAVASSFDTGVALQQVFGNGNETRGPGEYAPGSDRQTMCR